MMMTKTREKNKPTNQVRLNRYLAMAGIASRRACDEYILAGRVQVNGVTVDRLGVRIDPRCDEISFDGQAISGAQKSVYLLMNKPLRTVTTARDERGRRSVMDLIDTHLRLFPVGRLDYNTSGALLITNDGDLAYSLIHPRFEVRKVYRVLLDRVIRPIDLHHFRKGVVIDGRKTSECSADELRILDNRSFLEVVLHEGRNRQIRKMFDLLGYKVEELHRFSFAGLEVGNLKPGEYRELTPREVEELRRLVGT